MKKISKLLIALAFASACSIIAGCGGGSDSSKGSSSVGGGESSSSSAEPVTLNKVEDLLANKTVTLVDLDGATTYDLSTLMTEDEQTAIDAATGTVTWALEPVHYGSAYSDASSTISFASVSKAYYKVIAYETIAEGNNPIAATYVDFYDKNDGFVWNTYNGKDDFDKIDMVGTAITDEEDKTIILGYEDPSNTTITSVTDPSFGGKGDWYCFDFSTADSGHTKDVWITLSPLHSPEYCALYTEEGWQVMYDFYIEVGDGIARDDVDDIWNAGDELSDYDGDYYPYGAFSIFGGYYKGTESYTRRQIMLKEQQTIVMPISSYANADWVYMIHFEDIGYANSESKWSVINYKTAKLYIGNVQVVAPFDAVVGGEALIDTTSTETYDVTKLLDTLTAEQKAEYDEHAKLGELAWTLTSRFGTKVTLSDTTVKVADFEQMYYDVTVSLKNVSSMVLFEGGIDFYDSSKTEIELFTVAEGTGALTGIWGDMSQKRKIGSLEVVEIKGTDAEDENHASGNYFKYTSKDVRATFFPLPIHGKTYYEMFRDKNYTISFDIYVEVDADTIKFCIGGADKPVQNGTMIENWVTYSVKLNDLLDHWYDQKEVGDGKGFINYGAYYSFLDYMGDTMTDDAWDTRFSKKVVAYIGNFVLTEEQVATEE